MCWQGGTTCNCQCRWAICPNHLVFGTLAIFVPLPCEIGASFSLTTTCGISSWGLRSLMPDENEPYLLNFGRGTNFFTHSIKSGTHSNAMVWILLAARQCFCMVTRDVEGKKLHSSFAHTILWLALVHWHPMKPELGGLTCRWGWTILAAAICTGYSQQCCQRCTRTMLPSRRFANSSLRMRCTWFAAECGLAMEASTTWQCFPALVIGLGLQKQVTWIDPTAMSRNALVRPIQFQKGYAITAPQDEKIVPSRTLAETHVGKQHASKLVILLGLEDRSF